MQGFCNQIYKNSHEITSWYPDEGKKNVNRGVADAITVGTGGGMIKEGEVNIVQGTYLHIL